MPMLIELHKIECEKVMLHHPSFTINDTNIYRFRSIAFDILLTKNPDAKLIAHYEDLNQKLAAIEYFMSDDEKENYYSDSKEEYLKPCR